MQLFKFLAITSVVLCAATSAQDRVSAESLKDQLAYLTSISMPSMKAACSTVYPSFGSALDALYGSWLPANKEAIDRGKQMQIAALSPDVPIEKWEEDTRSAVMAEFESVSRDRREKRCFGLFASLSLKK